MWTGGTVRTLGLGSTHRPLPGFEVHELIAGPLAASMPSPRPPADGLQTQVHFVHGGAPTFGKLHVSGAGVTARLFDGDGRLLAERVLAGEPR